ncbi:MAG: VCBS repeat-containing protein [Rhodothermales bacterium]|nr:VCBS repeat-containing protein [Rhodothermales bacterium]
MRIPNVCRWGSPCAVVARRATWLALLVFLPLQGLRAQAVVVVRGVPLSAFGSIDAADFDGDGDNDLMVIGQNADGDPITGLYAFQARVEEPIPRSPPRIVAVYESVPFSSRRMKSGRVSWADMDADGDPDLLVSGLAVVESTIDTTEELPATDVFENQGGQALIFRTPTGLPPLVEPRLDWADVDGDGLLDLALAGIREDGLALLAVFRNDGDFAFSPILELESRLETSDLAFGDVDGDGDQDVIATGTGSNGPETLVLRNSGGTFTTETAPFPDWLFTRLAAGDVDGDGDDDVAFTGGVLSPDLVSGQSTLAGAGPEGFDFGNALDGVFAGAVQWADHDLDGDLDLLLAGVEDLQASDNQRLILYRNEAGSLERLEAFRGVLFGTVLWFDYDGNGLLDVLMAGVQEGRLIMSIFEL